MKHKLSILAVVLGASGLLATTSSHATGQGFYIGASAGYSALNTPSGSAFNAGGEYDSGTELAVQTSSTSDTGGFGGSLFVGYNINSTYAVELGYTTYAESSYKSSQSNYTADGDAWDYTNQTNTSSVTYNTNSIDLFLKGTVPVIAQVSAFAKVGLSYVRQSVDYSDPVGTPAITIDNGRFATPDSGVNTYNAIRPAAALGLTYQATEHLSTSLFAQGFLGRGDFETENDAIASAYIIGASVAYDFL